MSNEEEELLNAQFSMIKSKSDYQIIKIKLTQIAKEYNIELYPAELW